MCFEDGSDPTRPIVVPGNNVFGRATYALGIGPSAGRELLAAVLNAHELAPRTLTREDLTRLLPDIEARLREHVPPEELRECLVRLRELAAG